MILIRQDVTLLFFEIFSVYLIYNIRYPVTLTYFPWSPEVALLLHPAGAFARPPTAALFGSYYFSILKVGISAVDSPPVNSAAKSLKLSAFVDEKDKLNSNLLRFERYAENTNWEKITWAIKLSALLSGRAMDVYTRMSNEEANNYDKFYQQVF